MQLHIVLVSPARAENVGAAARAMKTMGLTSLRIVNSEVHTLPAAHWVAHGATEILKQALVFTTLEEALQDVDFTIATTARTRARHHQYLSPDELLTQLEEKRAWCRHIALVFGCEESGLSNEDLQRADLLTGIPMQSDYPSLNLGQAVMVYCYQLSSLMGVKQIEEEKQAEEGQLRALRLRTEQLLDTLAVSDDQKLSEWIQDRLGVLTQRDVSMMHTLLHDIEKRLKSKY